MTGGGVASGAVAAATDRARRLPTTIATDIGPTVREAVLGGVAATRGTLSVSGIGESLDAVAVTRVGGDASASVELRGTPRKAWGLVSGTKAHRITRHARLGRRGALRLKDGRFFANVNHPGTPTIDYWGNATTAAQPDISASAAESAKRNNPFKGST